MQRKIGPNAAGKKVINKKTGKKYIANLSNVPGKYSLSELDYLFYQATIIVDENDDDYDILMESPTEKNYHARRNEIDSNT
ncbi:MAG TPA: hypothetical protein VKB86_06645, partial [Pyrinomonadaceae bacterium]|nr:hypothetical protein [Pyrinomonadaceae bacterium]